MKMIKGIFYVIMSCCMIIACSDTTDIPLIVKTEKQEFPDAWHDKMRTQPYPKMSNELYINPPPLIVPREMKEDEFCSFSFLKI